MGEQEEYRQLLEEARLREERFKKALRDTLKAMACDGSERKIKAIISEVLCENPKKGGGLDESAMP